MPPRWKPDPPIFKLCTENTAEGFSLKKKGRSGDVFHRGVTQSQWFSHNTESREKQEPAVAEAAVSTFPDAHDTLSTRKSPVRPVPVKTTLAKFADFSGTLTPPPSLPEYDTFPGRKLSCAVSR